MNDVAFDGRDSLVTLRLQHADRCLPGFSAPRIGDRIRLSVEGDAVAYRPINLADS
ncbi:hypothetical protein [Caballeronia sp. INDeC2]|uniref:hypothetical protein n=1 Tax=Caballeronia sp. INDeC2 TaxID=2921747 RepID=UPI002028CDCF|nr:hypothetical protein [Caballeronia sp. INDeC2]